MKKYPGYNRKAARSIIRDAVESAEMALELATETEWNDLDQVDIQYIFGALVHFGYSRNRKIYRLFEEAYFTECGPNELVQMELKRTAETRYILRELKKLLDLVRNVRMAT